jgi:hypothetical protein
VRRLGLPYLFCARARTFHDAKGKTYLAVTGLMTWQGKKLVGFERVETLVTIFDEAGQVFQESLEGNHEAITTMLNEEGGESLLLGGEGAVLRYEITAQR